ncbi:MAG: BON domain-containing protein [Deltaproteobacteria bacterium]|nr:BON domain-containing protein [Deltaproteobacteria bacterium]
MYKTMRSFAVLTMIFALFTGCQALTGETLGRNIDDATLTTWVKSKLVADKATNLTRVQVTTNNGVVHLTGTVESAEWRNRAEQIAQEVDGVKGVVNNIQLQR